MTDALMKHWPKVVKVTHGKGRCVINIPAKWARDTGLDKADHALVARKGLNKLEVSVFHGTEDFKEYIPGNKFGAD